MIFILFYLATTGAIVGLVLWLVWQVVSALNRISQAVADIAESVRRMESAGPRPAPNA
jgi:mannose/fructose/N-acetylgalactosamine-specific phosphotransferase system component IID